MTMITPSYLGETIEYSSLHACRSTLEDPTLEYSHGKLAEKEKKTEDAKKYFDAAAEIYGKLPGIAGNLAKSDELLDGLREYSRSYYSRGLAKKRINPAEARQDFQTSWNIRKQVYDDYRGHQMDSHLQLDLFFSQLALGEVKETAKTLTHLGFIYLTTEPSSAYRVACLYALAAETIEESSGGKLTESQSREQTRYRREAIKFLQSAHDRGFTDFFQSNIDADLDFIRDDPAMKEFEATHHYLLGVQESKRGDVKKTQAEFKQAQAFAHEWMDKFPPKHERQAQVKGIWLCAHARLGNHAEAVQIADKMLPKLGSNRAATFRLARVFALAADAAKDDKVKAECRAKAFMALDQAAYGNLLQVLEAEQDLDSLRGDPRYRETKRRYETAPKPIFP